MTEVYTLYEIKSALLLFSTLARNTLGYIKCYETRRLHGFLSNGNGSLDKYCYLINLNLVANVYDTRIQRAKRNTDSVDFGMTMKSLLQKDLDILLKLRLLSKIDTSNAGKDNVYRLNKEYCKDYKGSLVHMFYRNKREYLQ